MSTRAEYPPSSTASKKKMIRGELTLDDIESYTLQLKQGGGADINENFRTSKVLGGSTDGMNGSTDGLMGSNDSLLSDEMGEKDELSYQTLRASLIAPGARSYEGSTSALVDESDVSAGINNSFSDDQTWDYPGEELEPYSRRGESSSERSRSRSRPRPPRKKLSTQNSMRALVGDDERDSDYQKF